jgi:Rps23 Pro-64 3,4-dihydroxylase Tpa1-like proline 4-hydroxylase
MSDEQSSSCSAVPNPSAKRAKTSVVLQDVVSPEIFARQAEWKEQYQRAQPYPHCVLPDVFHETFFEQLLLEIKDNSKVNFKESDLFKFFQSIDLANLQHADDDGDKNDASNNTPCILQLRNVLYSDQWRQYIESVTGLVPGTLSQQVDCACNCHVGGCHLLCHDDVINTRKISFILYLTDPDWTLEEGGALELYAADADRLPTVIPTASVLPIRNSMALFGVEPGVSFHAVQEVLGDRPRLSLQGWYHAKDVPVNMQDATLQRLKSTIKVDGFDAAEYAPMDLSTNESTTESPAPTAVSLVDNEAVNACVLSESDQAYLAQFIDPTYMQPNALEEMKALFEDDSSIQLRSFLNKALVEKIELQETRLGVAHKSYYVQGVSDAWKLVGPAHMQRYLQYNVKYAGKDESLGDVLMTILRDVLQSPAFARFLAIITGLRPTGYKGDIRRFRPGLDYTVAHCGLLADSAVLDATMCFVAGTGKQQILDDDELEGETADDTAEKPAPDTRPELNDADLAWQSGDVGGFECYIEADDDGDDEAADEYNQDDDTELLSVSAAFNTLSIVFRDPGTMRFVKYISDKAPSSRWDIAMEYRVEGTDAVDET